METPRVLVVGGPNGAGKTTLALELASALGLPYVGADDIAARLHPSDPASVRIEAGRRFHDEIARLAGERESFVTESTLAGRSLAGTLTRLRAGGYHVALWFVFLESVGTCIARVAERVQRGGHDVPEADIRRRFVRSLVQFDTLYRPMADEWHVVYNGADGIKPVLTGDADRGTVADPSLHESFRALLREHA